MWPRPPTLPLRVKPTPGSQLALFATYSYHGFITDRDGETLELEADIAATLEIENAIRDLKYGVGLNHLPSGRFAANAAWLAVQAMAHNLARWTARIGLGKQVVTTKTLRRRFFSLARRLTHSACRLTLHLLKRWPWEAQFSCALARLPFTCTHPCPGLPVQQMAHRLRRGDCGSLRQLLGGQGDDRVVDNGKSVVGIAAQSGHCARLADEGPRRQYRGSHAQQFYLHRVVHTARRFVKTL